MHMGTCTPTLDRHTLPAPRDWPGLCYDPAATTTSMATEGTRWYKDTLPRVWHLCQCSDSTVLASRCHPVLMHQHKDRATSPLPSSLTRRPCPCRRRRCRPPTFQCLPAACFFFCCSLYLSLDSLVFPSLPLFHHSPHLNLDLSDNSSVLSAAVDSQSPSSRRMTCNNTSIGIQSASAPPT